MTDQPTLRDMLAALYVWPQSIADHHADILTPRQMKKLYDVGEVADKAVAEIDRLTAELTTLRADRDAVEAQNPQDHWTVKALTNSLKAVIKAGNALCVNAETSGGVAGRDDGLVSTINQWASERDKHQQIIRIVLFEGHSPEIGAGILHPEAIRQLKDIPNPKELPIINHIDNDPKNNRVDNLEWCTQYDNLAHMTAQGRRAITIGRRPSHAILNDTQVSEIRNSYSKGSVSYSKLASDYGVCKRSIGRVIRREYYV